MAFESAAALAGLVCAFSLQHVLDPLHGAVEIARHAGPVGGINARLAIERIHAQAGIVGKRQKPRGLGRGMGLDPRVFDKGRAGLFGFGQAEFAGRDQIETERFEQLAEFTELAGIMRGDDQPVAGLQTEIRAHQSASASFCRATSSPMPLPARSISAMSSSRENGAPSAVPWISTNVPEPVMTKLASVSASESSS